MSRRSYRGLIGKPAWGLYRGLSLIATVRASEDVEALALFEEAGWVKPWDQIVNLDEALRVPDQPMNLVGGKQ